MLLSEEGQGGSVDGMITKRLYSKIIDFHYSFISRKKLAELELKRRNSKEMSFMPSASKLRQNSPLTFSDRKNDKMSHKFPILKRTKETEIKRGRFLP